MEWKPVGKVRAQVGTATTTALPYRRDGRDFTTANKNAAKDVNPTTPMAIPMR